MPYMALWGTLGCVHTCGAYHRHGETMDRQIWWYVNGYPRSWKLANFMDFGILVKIQNFTKSMDFMISVLIWVPFWTPFGHDMDTPFGTSCTWYGRTMYLCMSGSLSESPLGGSDHAYGHLDPLPR